MPPEKPLIDQYKELTGANKFIAEHCGKTLSEQEKLLRGISHSVNRCNAEYADCWSRVEEIQKRIDALEKENSDCKAEVGKLQEAMEGARKAYAELVSKNQLKTGTS